MGLLDTGNLGKSLISTRLAERMNLKLEGNTRVKMADGKTTQCFDVVDEIEMNYENRKLRTTIRVLEELQQDLLVGLGDINKMGIGIMGFTPEMEEELEQHPSLVDECLSHPDQEMVKHALKELIEENSQVSGFCPLEESIVHLKLKPGCDDDHLVKFFFF